jgi:hypothetical protein
MSENKKPIIGKISFAVILFVILDLILAVMIVIFRIQPSIAENVYSKTVYPVITFILGKFSDIFFFSITETVIIILASVVLIRMLTGFFQIVIRKLKFKVALVHFIKQSFILTSIVVIWFYATWGFNYFRTDLKLNEKKYAVTEEYFIRVMKYVIEKANAEYVKREYTLSEVNDKVNIELAAYVRNISGKQISPAKKYKFSMFNLLSSSNTLGVISPFFLESHISNELLDSEMPSVLAHEKSHLFGYANEAEANLISFLTCIHSDDGYFRYSGYCDILQYFLGAYKKTHTKEEYFQIYDTLRGEIKDEFARSYKRYKKHDSPLNRLFNKIYDFYLKVNNVKEGTESYSQVVRLILENRLIDI